MKNIYICIGCLLILLSSSLVIASEQRIVLGYYPNWDKANPPSNINYELFTHLCLAFATPEKDGHLKISSQISEKELITRAHEKKVKVLLSLGGYKSNENFAKSTTNVEYCDRLVSETLTFVQQRQFDGVDVDWEFPNTTETMFAYTQFMKDLRKGMDEMKGGDRMILSTALSGTDWNSKYVDFPAIASVVDFINVMTYDDHGGWSNHSGHNAPLYYGDSCTTACEKATVDAMMTYMTDKGCPRNKLIIGLPLYAREFVATGLGHKIDEGKRIYDYIPYNKIPSYMNNGWTYHWDSVAHVPWLSNKENNRIISFDNVRSILDKVKYAKEKQFGGIFFWEITQDRIEKDNVIIRAAREELFK